jgi:hypothetical protein
MFLTLVIWRQGYRQRLLPGLNFLFLDEEVVVLALSLFQLDMIHVKSKRGFSRLKSSSALQINVDDQVHEQK